MNSEELEKSLRTEFEGYLKNILSDMSEEMSQFRQKVETEIESHKSHLDDVFSAFSTRIQTQKVLDAGFKDSVVEHLRLARDEGARITATAIAEAEELTKSEKSQFAEAKHSVDLGDIRDAINDISSQNSQSSILKSLIAHAAKFVPRGAFFVVKNQHFVGWRVFGTNDHLEPDSITEIVFPVAASTVLGESVNKLRAIASNFGTFSEDTNYLEQLGFSEPDEIFAVPLVARGRGVAAIYADNGDRGEKVNLEALETLVSVAGLTVELLAAAQNSNYAREVAQPAEYVGDSASSKIAEAVGGESQDEFVAETSVDSEEVEAVSYDAVESDEADDTPSEVEASEEVAYQAVESDEPDEMVADDESAAPAEEEVTYWEPSETATEPVYEFSESADEDEITSDFDTAEIESTEVSSIDDGYSVYDDDLIEEVQTQTDAHSEEITEVYEEVSASEFSAEDESDEIETIETVVDEPVETASEMTFESASPVSESVYDLGIHESATAESTSDGISSDFSAPSPFAEFETNQDFNSTRIEFKAPADAIDEIEEVAPEVDEIEEISFSSPKPVEEPKPTDSFMESLLNEPEPIVAAPPVVRSRLADRNLDLPIDVSEDERRLHNDARRFARLLVSEIKLYNEQKVKEGREANDLYDRLREALDRSREMYDKRVQPAVVDRFDYFHYEVVNSLADGEESRLGSAYPGTTVNA